MTRLELKHLARTPFAPCLAAFVLASLASYWAASGLLSSDLSSALASTLEAPVASSQVEGNLAFPGDPSGAAGSFVADSAPLAQLQARAPLQFAAAQAKTLPSYRRLLLEELGFRKPLAAVSLLEEITGPERSELTLELAGRWSQSDPAAALAWFQGLAPQLERGDFLSGLNAVLRQYATRAPRFALESMKASLDAREGDDLLPVIASALSAASRKEALLWIDSLDTADFSPGAITEAYASLLRASSGDGPLLAAMDVASQMPESVLLDLAPELAASWASSDLHAALDWLDTLPDSRSKAACVSAIAMETFEKSPEAALELLLAFPDLPGFSDALAVDFGSVAAKQPDLIVRRFEELPVAAREESAAQIARAWLERPESVPDYPRWFQDLGEGEARDAAIRVAIHHLAEEQTPATLSLIGQLSSESEQFERLAALVEATQLGSLPLLTGKLDGLRLSPGVQSRLEAAIDERIERALPRLSFPAR